MTTLAIVLTGSWSTGLTSTALTAHAFTQVLGGLGGWIVAFGSITFGYSTLLTWSYYGLKCTDFIFGVRVSLPYRWIWCFVIIVGALFSDDKAGIKFIWNIADTVNGAMAIPNLIGLLWLSRIIFRETSAYVSDGAKTGSVS
jgi:AGCS family alanine or glycine:cation symporter